MGMISNFIQTKSLFLENISKSVRQVHANNIVFTLQVRHLICEITYYPHFYAIFHLYKIFFFTFVFSYI